MGTAFGGIAPAAAMHEPLPDCTIHDLAAIQGEEPRTIEIGISLQDSDDGLPDPIDALNVTRDGNFLVQLNTSADLEEGPAPIEFVWIDNITLGDDETHTYTVTPICGGAEGPTAGPVQATTIGPPTLPGAPQNLEAEAAGPRVDHGPGLFQFSISTNLYDVQLAWHIPEDDGGAAVEFYNIYRGTDPGALSLVATTHVTDYLDENLDPTENYFYVVSAVNSVGEGPDSNLACTSASPFLGPLESPLGTPCDPLV